MAIGFSGLVSKLTLADALAQKIKGLIDGGQYGPGDRLPSIAALSRQFGVGPPTLREALKKLETAGAVTVRHGSGVYVNEAHDALFLSNPVRSETPSKQLLLDLIEARITLEVLSAARAAEHATPAHLARMEALLAEAAAHLDDDAVLIPANMDFHAEIAAASGNAVLRELLVLLTKLFRQEQQAVLRIYGSRDQDLAEHLGILEALKAGDPSRAAGRMRAHLEGVRAVLLRWEPEEGAPA
jgi:GntR family transcriptional repressor for pyruvate dehydrogenase complex